MANAKDPQEPFLSTNVEASPPSRQGHDALRNPPIPLRVMLMVFAAALVAMVVAIAVLKTPGG